MQAFLDSDAQELVLGPSAFEGPVLSLHSSLHAEASHLSLKNASLTGSSSLAEQLWQHSENRYAHVCCMDLLICCLYPPCFLLCAALQA